MEQNAAEYVFIDLRNPNVFNRGTIPGALNIPVSDILKPENIAFYKEMAGMSVKLVLFAGNQQSANGPWMLLRQIGIENLLMMMGGYDYVAGNLPEVTINKPYHPEEPILDFAGFMENLGLSPANKEENTPLQIQTVPRKKKSAAEGGC